jgi:hypothetical protein
MLLPLLLFTSPAIFRRLASQQQHAAPKKGKMLVTGGLLACFCIIRSFLSGILHLQATIG